MPPDPAEALRARGLRVTPQRRAILGAFSDRPEEHLSADEIHARAAAVVPEIGRGTVYATLAELTELGLLAAFGAAEPVRYETNTADHAHFRCRLCLRLFDVDLAPPRAASLERQGYARRAHHDRRRGDLPRVPRIRARPRGRRDGARDGAPGRRHGAGHDRLRRACDAARRGHARRVGGRDGPRRLPRARRLRRAGGACAHAPRPARRSRPPRARRRRDRRLLRRRARPGRRDGRLGDRPGRRRRVACRDPPRPVRGDALVRPAGRARRSVRHRLRAGDQSDAVPVPVPPRDAWRRSFRSRTSAGWSGAPRWSLSRGHKRAQAALQRRIRRRGGATVAVRPASAGQSRPPSSSACSASGRCCPCPRARRTSRRCATGSARPAGASSRSRARWPASTGCSRGSAARSRSSRAG